MKADSPLSAVKAFCLAHFVRRDLEQALAYVTADVVWFGTGVFEIVQNREDARRLLAEEILSMPGGYTVAFGDMREKMLSDDAGTAFGQMLVADNVGGSQMDSRVMATCVRGQEGFQISSLHMSLPSGLQNEREYYPESFVQKRFQEMLDSFCDAVIPGGLVCCEVSEDFRILSVNQRLVTMLGYDSKAEFMTAVGGNFAACVVSQDDLADIFEKTNATPISSDVRFTYRMRTKSGAAIWVRDASHKYSDENGNPVILCFCTDISDILQLERDIVEKQEQLEQANAKLSTIMDSIPGGIAVFEVSPSGIKNVFVNQGLIEMGGYTVDEYKELDKNGIHAPIFAEDLPELKRQLRRLATNNVPVNCECRMRKKGGGFLWINLYGVAKDRREDTACIHALLVDVTAKKAAEEQLRIREEEYRIAVAHSGKMVYRYTVADRSTYMPSEVAAILGLPSRMLDVPRSVVAAGMVAPQSEEAFTGFYQAILRGDETGRALALRKATKGDRWFETNFTTIFDDTGAPASAVISIEDVTEERETSKADALDRQRLLVALQSVYPLALAVNLTKDKYTVLSDTKRLSLPYVSGGNCDELIAAARNALYPDDVKEYMQHFGVKNLLSAFAQGKDRVRMEFRYIFEDGRYHWCEAIALRVNNVYDNDVVEITLARCIDEQKAMEEKLRQALAITNGELAKKTILSKNGRFFCAHRHGHFPVG